MKTKILLIAIIASFTGLIAQQKDVMKLQKADESGFIEVDKAPELISQLKPAYPQLAKLSGIQGIVYLKLLIDEKGNVDHAIVLQGVKDMIDEAALTAAKKAKFSPALLKDKPVKVWVVLPIAFKLDVDKNAEANVMKYDELGPPPSNNEEKEPDINKFVQVEKLPEMIEAAKPDYPALAKKAGIEGKVFVKVLVGKDGIPKKAVVSKSDNEIFNQSAVDAAMKSKFTPAENKGEKIVAWIVLPYKYTLEMSEINSSWSSTPEKAAAEYASLIKSIEQTGEYENVKHEIEKTKRLETDLKYGDESALFQTEGKSYSKFLFITRKGRGIVRTTQVSIDDVKQYIVKNMDKVFKDLEKKKKRFFIFNFE